MKLFRLLLVSLFIVAANLDAFSQSFLSVEIGGHYAPSLSFVNTSTDRASVCDEYINPLYASVPGCTDPNPGEGSTWEVDTEAATGLTASLTVGRRLSRLIRAELEYLYSHSAYNQIAEIGSSTGAEADKLAQEIYTAREFVGDFTSHNLMLSGSVALTPRIRGPWIPYVGAGAGMSRVNTFYSSTWYRNPNVAAIQTGEGLPNVEEVRRNLAGTMSNGNAELRNYILAWQLTIGMDYMLTRRVSLGAKLRRIDYTRFESDSLVWDPLRSHAPNNRRDGSEPVKGIIGTSELETITMALVMRYHF